MVIISLQFQFHQFLMTQQMKSTQWTHMSQGHINNFVQLRTTLPAHSPLSTPTSVSSLLARCFGDSALRDTMESQEIEEIGSMREDVLLTTEKSCRARGNGADPVAISFWQFLQYFLWTCFQQQNFLIMKVNIMPLKKKKKKAKFQITLGKSKFILFHFQEKQQINSLALKIQISYPAHKKETPCTLLSDNIATSAMRDTLPTTGRLLQTRVQPTRYKEANNSRTHTELVEFPRKEE